MVGSFDLCERKLCVLRGSAFQTFLLLGILYPYQFDVSPKIHVTILVRHASSRKVFETRSRERARRRPHVLFFLARKCAPIENLHFFWGTS